MLYESIYSSETFKMDSLMQFIFSIESRLFKYLFTNNCTLISILDFGKKEKCAPKKISL